MSQSLIDHVQRLISRGNHLEFVFLPSFVTNRNDDNQDAVISHNVPHDIFIQLMKNMKKANLHGFQKHYKEYVYRNLYYEHSQTETTNIHLYKKEIKVIECGLHDSLCVMASQRDKISYHIFPSTNKIPSVAYVSKATFKINNRIFINFESKKYTSTIDEEDVGETYNKIYINYNHDENVDVQKSVENIDKALKALDIVVV